PQAFGQMAPDVLVEVGGQVAVAGLSPAPRTGGVARLRLRVGALLLQALLFLALRLLAFGLLAAPVAQLPRLPVLALLAAPLLLALHLLLALLLLFPAGLRRLAVGALLLVLVLLLLLALVQKPVDVLEDVALLLLRPLTNLPIAELLLDGAHVACNA